MQRYLAARTDAEIAAALGAVPAASDEETGLRGIETLESLAVSAGIPMRLRDWSIPHSAIEGMATAAMEVQRLLRNNVRETTFSDAMEIYKAAY